jgi:hypothetical protein
MTPFRLHKHARGASHVLLAAIALLCPLGLLAAGTANAVDPSSYLLTPVVTEGEREIDVRSGVGSTGRSTSFERVSGLGVGWGVNSHWYSELGVQYRHVGRSGTVYDAAEWENIVQLAEPNEWPVDVGIAYEMEIPHDSSEGVGVRFGPLLQKDFGSFEANLNILLDHHINSRTFASTQVQYQAQLRYRYSRPLEFGVQAFGNLGTRLQGWAAYELQSHRIGPVVQGRFPLAHERGISYNLAFLLGTTARSPDRTLRLQFEYEF